MSNPEYYQRILLILNQTIKNSKKIRMPQRTIIENEFNALINHTKSLLELEK